jgi:hypothetical protein
MYCPTVFHFLQYLANSEYFISSFCYVKIHINEPNSFILRKMAKMLYAVDICDIT